MATVGVALTKSTAFRDSTQEFSNVYYFGCGLLLPDLSEANSLIDALKAIEVPFHSTAVTFLRGRVWSQVGLGPLNNMISQKTLSGTGSTTVATSFDKERAFLFRLRAGNDSRGNPVYLRKWYHSCGAGPGNNPVSTANLENTSSMSTGVQSAMETAVNTIKSVTAGGKTYTLQAKSGRNFDAGVNFQSHKYLEHHQLGDQWRG